MKNKIPFVIVTAALATTAFPQVITERFSEQTYSWYSASFGGFEDGDDYKSDNGVVQVDNMVSQVNEQFSGTSAFGNWSTSVAFQSNHTYRIDGPLDKFTRIIASGSSEAVAQASGTGASSRVGSGLRGNSLLFRFQLNNDADYRLRGNLTAENNSSTTSFVKLEKFENSSWTTIGSTLDLPAQSGDFQRIGTLDAGLYQLTAELEVFSLYSNGSDTASFNYDLEVVPEPATMTLAAMATLAMYRRKKQKA